MEKLISMTDFVLEQDLKIPVGRKASDMVKYGLFLKQVLGLWMFVPCKLVNGVWIVLEEPKEESFYFDGFLNYNLFKIAFKEYQEAKDRVLFSYFKLKRKPFEDFDFIGNDKMFVFKKHCRIKHWSINARTKKVEDLVKYNLELTPATQNQFP